MGIEHSNSRKPQFLKFMRNVLGFARRYHNWREVARLFWLGEQIRHLQPRLGGNLFFPDGSRPLLLMNEVWWEDEYQLNRINLSKGDTVVDIGANVGVFSWFVLSRFPGVYVHAIEPHPVNYDFLKKNLQPWQNTVKTWNQAISNKNGHLELLEPEWLDGVRVVSEEDPMENIPQKFKRYRGSKIPCSRLGVLFERAGIDKVAVLKIDIEGAERYILDEFRCGLLSRIERVCMECHEHEYKGLSDEFISVFKRYGFSIQIKVLCEERSILLATKE